MVLVEEIEEEEQPKENKAPAKTEGNKKGEGAVKLKKGFLESNSEPLYPPEGSSEGFVAPETKKAHAEHKMNQDLNKSMNKGAENNNNIERPSWYTKEWPKDCQYNAPGCHLHEMEASGHKSDIHREMVRGERWKEGMEPGIKSIRLSFMQATDEDMAVLVEHLKGNKDVTELDLSHNHIKDTGVQKLVGALAAGAAPELKELRIYNNDFGDLGKVMLTQGLKVMRKKLEIVWEEPSWMKAAKEAKKPQEEGASAEGASAEGASAE